jgi:large subunit ribosomal protein L21
MYAVFQTGGKQYKVAKDQMLTVEKLEAEPGVKLTFESVLMVGDEATATIGAPFVAGAAVSAEVVEQNRAPKIIVFKKKRRKGYRRRKGHRQHQTLLRITDILTAATAKPTKAKSKAAPKAKAEDKQAVPEPAAPEPATQESEE